jgi:hypothetical protein
MPEPQGDHRHVDACLEQAGQLPVPEIRPAPSRRSDRGAMETHLAPARPAPPKQSQQPELPDLLEAFWGEGREHERGLGARRARGHRRASADPT